MRISCHASCFSESIPSQSFKIHRALLSCKYLWGFLAIQFILNFIYIYIYIDTRTPSSNAFGFIYLWGFLAKTLNFFWISNARQYTFFLFNICIYYIVTWQWTNTSTNFIRYKWTNTNHSYMSFISEFTSFFS